MFRRRLGVPMLNLDVFLLIIKYAGAVLSGAYGVYATITDFHETKNDKKILSRKGKLGIVLLIISTILSVSADGLKDVRERREARIEEDRRERVALEQRKTRSEVTDSLTASLATAKTLNSAVDGLRITSEVVRDNSKMTTRILEEEKRTAGSFSLANLNVFVRLGVPRSDPLFKRFLVWQESRRMEESRKEPQEEDMAGVQTIEGPTDNPLVVFARNLRILLIFQRKPLTELGKPSNVSILPDPKSYPKARFHIYTEPYLKSDLVLELHCDNKTDREAVFNIDWHFFESIVFNCKGKVEVVRNDGIFRSFRDFQGAYTRLTRNEFPSVSFSSARVVLTTDDGRVLDYILSNHGDCINDPCLDGEITERNFKDPRLFMEKPPLLLRAK